LTQFHWCYTKSLDTLINGGVVLSLTPEASPLVRIGTVHVNISTTWWCLLRFTLLFW